MAADGSSTAVVDTINAGPVPAPAAAVPEPRQDERDHSERAPRTPSPWDADSDVHPVLERFKRVNPVPSAVYGYEHAASAARTRLLCAASAIAARC